MNKQEKLLHKSIFSIFLGLFLCIGTILVSEYYDGYKSLPSFNIELSSFHTLLDNSGDADILCIGSSITANGIIPSIIKKNLTTSDGSQSPEVWNLGLSSTNKFAHYHVLKKYLKKHKPPKLLLMDVRVFEYTSMELSRMSPYIPEFGELLEATLLHRLPFKSRQLFTNALSRSFDAPLQMLLYGIRKPGNNVHVRIANRMEKYRGFLPINCKQVKKNNLTHPYCDINFNSTADVKLRPWDDFYRQVSAQNDLNSRSNPVKTQISKNTKRMDSYFNDPPPWLRYTERLLVTEYVKLNSMWGLGHFTKTYMSKINALCVANNIKLVLWFPPYKNKTPAGAKEGMEELVYQSIDPNNSRFFIFERDDIHLDENDYSDRVHLYEWGAIKLSYYMAAIVYDIYYRSGKS